MNEAKRLLLSPPTTDPLELKVLSSLSPPEPEAKRKRKRSQDGEDLTLQDLDDPIGKRIRTALLDGSNKEQEIGSINNVSDFSIEHWRKTGHWSPKRLDLNSAMSRPLNNKRSSSSLSYTQSVREGLNPPQYTPGYEEVLQDAGIYMNEELEQTISSTSQELCDVLLNSFFPPPSNSLFAGRSFLLTLDEARNENEPRVQRDVTPLLVPCASLLYLYDRVLQCRHLSAKIQSEWTKVTPLAGPLPTPDYVVGLKRSAFTRDEILRLQIYSAPNKAAMFRDGLFFPFLVCEVKCGENGLSVAERQSMHVASVAANAIVQLFRDQAVSQVEELDRELLVFSISHDHVNVKIHGHYASIEGDNINLHRHLIRGFEIRDQNGREKWTTYHVVRKIYDYFAPIHLERIRGAVAKLPMGSSFGLSSGSIGSNTGADAETESDSQEMTESAPSSQGTDRPKRARLKPTAMLQQEIDWLKTDREDQKRQTDALIKQMERQREEHKEQIEQQREEHKQEAEKQQEQIERRRLEHKQEVEKQQEQIERQREEHKQLMETLQSLSAQLRQSDRK